ncbi:MAG: YckD family protein [Bacillus sp. (in: Bacteria)]|nr:YckD family protein [Bacillus sp. (in: firmicutes)]
MKKYGIGFFIVAILFLSTVNVSINEVSAEGFNKDVKLTVEQIDEMAKLQQKALEQKVEIIHKYVEFGVFTEAKGEKIIRHIEEHYKELADNDFIPNWDKHKRHGKHSD